MAELTFKSPGVSTREIDLSAPTSVTVSGLPAGVIGTAVRGKAFVPVTVATFQDFINKFGNTDGEKFGPLAMREWLSNANAGTYLRLLGVGDGKARNPDGSVTNAGFTVGQQLVQVNGVISSNRSAHVQSGSGGIATEIAPAGRTYFLGCTMTERDNRPDKVGGIFQDSLGAIYTNATGSAKTAPILRAVIMAASGVIPALSLAHCAAQYMSQARVSCLTQIAFARVTRLSTA